MRLITACENNGFPLHDLKSHLIRDHRCAKMTLWMPIRLFPDNRLNYIEIRVRPSRTRHIDMFPCFEFQISATIAKCLNNLDYAPMCPDMNFRHTIHNATGGVIIRKGIFSGGILAVGFIFFTGLGSVAAEMTADELAKAVATSKDPLQPI